MSGASLMEFDLKLIEKHCPFIVVDDQGRRGTESIWMAGRNGKRVRATFRERPVILITSIGPEEEHRWKDAVTTGPEMQAWITNGTAHGMLPWFTKFNGVVPDTRWVQPVADGFGLHADLEPVLGTMAPTAEIAIIDPSTTLRHWAPEMRKQAEADDLGFYQALVEARLPFELLSDQMMTPERARRASRSSSSPTPAASPTRSAPCSATTSPAAAASSPPSRPRPATRTATRATASASRKCFGARLLAPARGPVKNTYVALNGEHPINRGFDGAARIIGGTRLDRASRPSTGADEPFLFVPDFPDLPMEEVYPREEPRGGAVIARENRAAAAPSTSPGTSAASSWEVLAADHQRLIANAVRWALKHPSRIEITGKSVLDVALRENADGLAVILHNLTNPMMLKGPTREIYPVGPQQVSVALDGKAVACRPPPRRRPRRPRAHRSRPRHPSRSPASRPSKWCT